MSLKAAFFKISIKKAASGVLPKSESFKTGTIYVEDFLTGKSCFENFKNFKILIENLRFLKIRIENSKNGTIYVGNRC